MARCPLQGAAASLSILNAGDASATGTVNRKALTGSLRHQRLYLNALDTLATVRKPVGWYVREHSTVLPHAAFDGQTPDEMYFGRGADIPDQLAQRRLKVRRQRLNAIGRQCARAVQPASRREWPREA